jgi:cell division protein FtsB
MKLSLNKETLAGFLRRRASLLLALALLALLVHDVFGDHGFLAMRRTQKEVEKLREEIQQLDQENARLAEEVKALKSDPRIIERIAREEMGLARPGELVFNLPPKPPEQPIHTLEKK